MDVTGAVELYVNKVAREIAPVRLTGNYGSEIVRRNVAFKPSPPALGLFEPGFECQIENAAQTYEARRGVIRFHLSRSNKCHGITIRVCRLNYRN